MFTKRILSVGDGRRGSIMMNYFFVQNYKKNHEITQVNLCFCILWAYF